MTRYALLAFVFVSMVKALVGENGYVATLRAQSEQPAVPPVGTQNQGKPATNLRPADRPKALEEAARRQLNMIK
jgi:hypothetical protein